MANLLHNRNMINLVGANAARTRLDKAQKTLPLSKLVQNIAFNIYVSSSRDLKLTHLMDSGFNGLTKDRGLPLARAFDSVISKGAYGARLERQPIPERAARKDLEELSRRISFDRIPADEKSILADALVPANPEDGEWHRLSTYALLLWLSKEKGAAVEESDVFAAALEPPSELADGLGAIVDGWLKYIVRDLLAVAHEAVFASIMREVDVKSAARGAPAVAGDVVASLLNATEEHNEALREFGLLKRSESVAERPSASFGGGLSANAGTRRAFRTV